MNIEYNEVIGALVNTANNQTVTQSELLEWAAENPMPLNEPKKSNQSLMNEVLDSLTVKQTPDNVEIEEGVETITDRG